MPSPDNFGGQQNADLATRPAKRPDFNARSVDAIDRVVGGIQSELLRQKIELADHSGQLKGVGAMVSAVQSSLGSWKTAAIGINAAVLAVVSIIGALVVWNIQKTEAASDRADAKIESVAARLSDQIGALQTGRVDARNGTARDQRRP